MSDYIEYCNDFASVPGDNASKVFQLHPRVFGDDRGSFTEVLKVGLSKEPIPSWMLDMSWIQQVNRSVSTPDVCRGMHAQKGPFCQSKLVECVSGMIYDFIVDARPDSETFGLFKCFPLHASKANKLFVPRGFLHGFYSPRVDSDNMPLQENVFQYFIGGGAYNHESEISININSILDRVLDSAKSDKLSTVPVIDKSTLILSEKDQRGFDFDEWMNNIKTQHEMTGEVWYR